MNSLKQLVLAAALGLAAPAHADLLGVTPGEPTISFGGAGLIDYDVATGTVTISAEPADLFQSDPFLLGSILGTGAEDERLFSIQFKVDSTGQFVSGVDGPDLIIKGSIDVDFDTIPDYDGVLLQAEVTAFGFQDGGVADDQFDIRLGSVTGALAGLYTGKDLAVSVTSEISTEFTTPFAGSFAADFLGQAKGVLGAINPVVEVAACHVDIEARCSVNGQRSNACKCRIPVSKSPRFWEVEDKWKNGRHCKRWKYGTHGQSFSWARRYETTPVKFTYVVTNTGTVPVLNLVIEDAFEGDIAGAPLMLAVGQSVTLFRTVDLNERVENTATVVGDNGAGLTCGDSDTVTVAEKLRDRRRHDDDRYNDKGKGRDRD
jgi:hypothetical protein